jgi:uncharacterized protein (TIGR02246 family)
LPTPEQTRVLLLYKDLIQAWNDRNATDFAAMFTSDGNSVGFDGSQMNGRREIHSEVKRIFADHDTATYVAKVKEIRELRPFVMLLRAVVGMVPPGGNELNPAANAIQSMVAVEREGETRIALLQNTPAAFHGRPELGEELTAELTKVLRSGEVVVEE